jgi:formylmethanofuran dehydrogenase subunit E-like metal-binding protein
LSNNPAVSTAKKPDLDWSQVRETINMLTLAVSQVECTMTDGEKSVTELTQSFTFIANQLKEVIDSHQGEENSKSDINIESLKLSASDIHQQIMSAIVAFQFYDRLTQRLDHVKRDLSWLSNLVSDPQQLYNPLAWSKLQEDIMSNYTMEEERIMFQHIMSGATVEEALEIYQHHFSNKKDESDDTSDEIELF